MGKERVGFGWDLIENRWDDFDVEWRREEGLEGFYGMIGLEGDIDVLKVNFFLRCNFLMKFENSWILLGFWERD